MGERSLEGKALHHQGRKKSTKGASPVSSSKKKGEEKGGTFHLWGIGFGPVERAKGARL